MNYTVEQEKSFQLLCAGRSFQAQNAMKEIPAFWEEYYKKGYGEIACGQFACCYDETEGAFKYAIGNSCVEENGVYHIVNRPDREKIPEGFELLTIPARTWMKVKCVGPLPKSIQSMYPVIQKEWPSDLERLGGWELEQYGYCNSPEDTQKEDYCCYIWIPVRKKCEILSLRSHPEMLEQFIGYFAAHWGREEVYRDCMTSALTSDSSLPQWYLAVTSDKEIAGGAGLISNDFISRMDLTPWLCALRVEEKFRHQGIGGKLIQFIAQCAEQTGYRDLFCCTDHTGYYEQYGFEFIGTGYHPWGESSRIFRKKLSGAMNIKDQFNQLAAEYDPNRRKFIPCFDDYYEESTAAAAALAGNPKRILDLGAGTGLLTVYWLKKFPQAQYVLSDIADEMLKVARKRFAALDNVSYQVSDYIRELPSGPFDVVMSALSIHHLEDPQKEDLFHRIYKLLPNGGWFFNYDQFCSGDEMLNRVLDSRWVGKIQSSGMSEADIARWKERRKLDKVCSMETETALLRRSGFEMAECFFLSGKFAVFAAQKRK